jgi:L-gulonolactone oxidase
VKAEAEGGFIRVEAGVSIENLSRYAGEASLTLVSTTVIPFVLVGGAIANGCHGTGVHHPHFTDLVRELELVDADGGLTKYCRPEPLGESPTAAELDVHKTWDALVVSLGTLGIIYSLTFDCVPMFNVRALDRHADMRETLDNVKELVERNEYAEIFWFPYQERVWIKTWNRTSEPPTGAIAARAWKSIRQAFQNYLFGPALLNAISVLPFLTPPAMKVFFLMIGKGDQVQPLPDALQYQTAFMKAVDMGYAIPIDDDYNNVRKAWNVVVERLDALRRERIYPQNLVMHLRFVGPGRGTISPSAGNERSCYIEILTYRNTPRYPEYFAAVESDWIRLGGRTHWAKLCFLPETVADSYRDEHRDRVKEFLEVRARHDPNEVFVNEWVHNLLGM